MKPFEGSFATAFEQLVLIKLEIILEELNRMTQVFDSLVTEIGLAIDEIDSLVTQVQAIASGTSDAQVQPVLDKLTAAVTAAKSALAAPAPVTATSTAPTATPVAAA